MGIFVAIEGGDGSGKGTQSEILRQFVAEELKKPVTKLSFPRYGEASAYYAEQYLNGNYGAANDVHPDLAALAYAIDRFAEKSDLEKLLAESDRVIIADRYQGSNLAHQGAKIADEQSRHAFYKRTLQTEYDILGIPRPSKNIVLLVPSHTAQANVDLKQSRNYTSLKRDIHEADADHLDKAKRNYEELCRLYPNEFIAIDCMQDDSTMRSIEDIQQEIRAIIFETTG